MRAATPSLSVLLSLALLAGCGNSHRHSAVSAAPPRPVSILVEAYDPVTNFVWENVAVRVVEASHTWSGCVCTNPVEEWFFTDQTGQVLIDEFALAQSEVGFLEDQGGGAIIERRESATVTLELDGIGLTPVVVDVPLDWNEPDVFVSVAID